MSLTITQAHAVNEAVRAVLPHAHQLNDDARDALEILVDAAYRKLFAGMSPEAFADAWERATAEGRTQQPTDTP